MPNQTPWPCRYVLIEHNGPMRQHVKLQPRAQLRIRRTLCLMPLMNDQRWCRCTQGTRKHLCRGRTECSHFMRRRKCVHCMCQQPPMSMTSCFPTFSRGPCMASGCTIANPHASYMCTKKQHLRSSASGSGHCCGSSAPQQAPCQLKRGEEPNGLQQDVQLQTPEECTTGQHG